MTVNTGEHFADERPAVGSSDTPHDAQLTAWDSLLKRAFDVAAASLLLAVFSVPALISLILVKLSSPGPAIYRQTRIGLQGREFDILKFRTMRLDAEAKSGPIWASDKDSRCTAVGDVLRHLFLDEVPQLINVIRGDMSLVGPRPERPFFIEQFRQQLPHYDLRHGMRPGITGLSQVYGWRGRTDIRMRTAHDIWYVERWSPVLDLMILGRTVLFVCRLVTREPVVMSGVENNPIAETEAIMAAPAVEEQPPPG